MSINNVNKHLNYRKQIKLDKRNQGLAIAQRRSIKKKKSLLAIALVTIAIENTRWTKHFKF